MTISRNGFTRGEDGVLVWTGGRHYDDPGEALNRHSAGELRPSCNERIYANYASYPCGKSPKHDPDKNGRMTKCGLHSASAKERRKKRKIETYARWKAEWAAKDELDAATCALEPALCQIADGHNDPRALAQEVLAKLNAARKNAKQER